MLRIAFILLVFSSFSSHKVVPDHYLVYHVNKEVHWMHDGKKEPAKRGVFLKAKHSLLLTPNANVMLIQNDGKSLLLKESGAHSFPQIKNRFLNLAQKGVTSSFFAYVFEKFLTAEGDETRQKISAVVFRGTQLMHTPPDSSILFTQPVTVQWKTKQPHIPYKLELWINGNKYDTTVRNTTSLLLPNHWMAPSDGQAKLVRWKCYPADSKQGNEIRPFLFLLPATNDQTLIQQQVKLIRNTYAKEKTLIRLMERDLFERWVELYQLQEY